ncbi:RidA family protein [Roseibaca sp. Y0-43]|uniref:RidA family protein n=1 Tax=Roseibaca sp. Y0-43 TaxID=2816854 RepID=UPI001D0C8A9C|nr:RidA family protein [Roseibaca sp. Y0-43]MCC1481942.1 RidA family protein [Roseibaca sp. Y0-43]
MTDTAKNLPQILNPADMPDPRPLGYSVAAIAPAGSIAFISGQAGVDAQGQFPPDFMAQLQLAYANLLAVLKACGAGPEHVVKLGVYVVDHEPSKLPLLTQAVTEVFGTRLPAQTLVPVPCLAIPPMLVEVEAVVAMP